MPRRYYYFGHKETSTCDVDALAYIAAHEAASGVTMGAVQQSANCTFFSMLKGNGTTYGSNLHSLMITKGTYLYLLSPSTDAVSSFAGIGVEMLSATTIGSSSWNGFVSGDCTPSGLSGGTGKYFDLGITPNAWNQNSVGLAFVSLSAPSINAIPVGANSVSSSQRHFIRLGVSPSTIGSSINSATYTTLDSIASSTGLLLSQRINSTTIDNYYNGSNTSTNTISSVSPTTNTMYAMARNDNGAANNFFDGVSGGWAFNLPVMTANEISDLYECISFYNNNIITGGR